MPYVDFNRISLELNICLSVDLPFTISCLVIAFSLTVVVLLRIVLLILICVDVARYFRLFSGLGDDDFEARGGQEHDGVTKIPTTHKAC